MTKIVETAGNSPVGIIAENPSLRQEDRNASQREERKRVPMSIPRRKLEVPEKPGFVRYWFNDYPGRIQQALQGGYNFVKADDTFINNNCLGADSSISGNTDMGTNVSLIVGKTEEGTALRAYLMEIKEEWFKEDQGIIQDKVDLVDKTIRRGKVGEDEEASMDRANRYVKTSNYQTNLSDRRA